MTTIEAGTATIKRKSGADWYLKYYAKLPEHYIKDEDVEKFGKNFPPKEELKLPCRIFK